MGFLEPIPAEFLSASYDPEDQTLRLYASGEALNFTADIYFERVPWLGGLKYELVGWVGPRGQGTRPYEVENEFKIRLTNPYGDVLIATANYPDGKLVPIHPLAEKDRFPPTGIEKLLDGVRPANVPEVTTKNSIHLNEIINVPFEIVELADVPPRGSVNITFDPVFLDMMNARIDDRNIVWKFHPSKGGTTQIIVTIHGGEATFIVQKTYDVNIIIFDAAKKTSTVQVSEQK
ncbi:hypothetical protein K440DRAFT_664529 [Wilcoxina mikolae CBS 423.85]|nr:hypothetical protein K440DRAFT_664529 [Wilcoxina mikolae CBS 423.85]